MLKNANLYKGQHQMNEDFYKQLMECSPIGYAYHKIISNETGTPCNYEFIEVNTAFEKLTGMKSIDIVGKTVTEVLPKIKKNEFDWIGYCADTSINGSIREFEQFSEPLNKWFRVNAYSPRKGYFATIITDITNERKQIEDLKNLSIWSEEFLQWIGKEIDYQKITDDFLELSDAKFAVFNLYDENGKHFTTIATAGDKGIINKAMNIMGMKFGGKKWCHDPARADKIKDKLVTRFSTLNDLAEGVISKPVVDLLTKSFGLGETILIKIMKNNIMLGDFTLMMPKGKTFVKDSIVEIFTRQLGLVIDKNRSDEKLKISEDRFQKVLSVVPDMISIHDPDMNIVYSNWNGFGAVPEDKRILNTKCYKTYRNHDDVCPDCQAAKVLQSKEAYQEEYKLNRDLWVELRVMPILDRDKNVEFFVEWVRDITEQKEKQKEIEYLSYHDQLTGLYNRRFYETELKRHDCERNLPLSMVILDVNGLKLTNDAFGHVLGDKVLIRVAELIKRECRSDEITSRIGGDEFVILLPKTDSENTRLIAERIQQAINNEKVYPINLSISLGWETKTTIDMDVDTVFKRAEDSMYYNKLSESTSMRYRTINVIMETLHQKNPIGKLHSERVSLLSAKIGTVLKLSRSRIMNLKKFGLMHDIGNIAMSDEIMNKHTSLSTPEWLDIKRHAEIGYQILSSVNEYSQLALYVLAHHEKWDGTGYPKGLKGEEIPLEARIMAIADAYVAMISDRPFRKALSSDEAMDEIKRNAGTQFDPRIARVFLEQELK